MSNLESRSTDLAAKIVAYCNEKTLSLGGLVARLEAGEKLDEKLCDEIGTYCNAHSLSLGVVGASLHAEVWALWEDYRGVAALQAEALEILRIETHQQLDDVQRARLVELSDALWALGSRLPDNVAPIKSDLIKIWRWNPSTGYWVYVRDCYRDRLAQWLKIFRGDDPGVTFKAATRRPVKGPRQ